MTKKNSRVLRLNFTSRFICHEIFFCIFWHLFGKENNSSLYSNKKNKKTLQLFNRSRISLKKTTMNFCPAVLIYCFKCGCHFEPQNCFPIFSVSIVRNASPHGRGFEKIQLFGQGEKKSPFIKKTSSERIWQVEVVIGHKRTIEQSCEMLTSGKPTNSFSFWQDTRKDTLKTNS